MPVMHLHTRCRALPPHAACGAPATHVVVLDTQRPASADVVRTVSCDEHRLLAAQLVGAWARHNLPGTVPRVRLERWRADRDPGVWILGAGATQPHDELVAATVPPLGTPIRTAA